MTAARLSGRPRDPELRIALANLHRPGAPTPGVVLALGLGLTVLVAADLLESCGIRCEILVSQATYNDSRLVETNVCVKAPGVPIDIDRLAFAIAHPSFFRRFGFAFCEANGHSPIRCRVASLSDYEKREGTVEVDGVCSGDGLSDSELRANVLAIAKGCGLEFSDEELAEITQS